MAMIENIKIVLEQNPLYILLFACGIGAVIMLIMMKNDDSDGKKNKKAESNSPALRIANEIINVMDIDDKFLYTRDGYIISFLKIGNINMELMGEDELKNMTMKLALS